MSRHSLRVVIGLLCGGATLWAQGREQNRVCWAAADLRSTETKVEENPQ